MKPVRAKSRLSARVDRHVSDEDVFEHVIVGVRVNQILQMLRDADSPTSPDFSESDPDRVDDARP